MRCSLLRLWRAPTCAAARHACVRRGREGGDYRRVLSERARIMQPLPAFSVRMPCHFSSWFDDSASSSPRYRYFIRISFSSSVRLSMTAPTSLSGTAPSALTTTFTLCLCGPAQSARCQTPSAPPSVGYAASGGRLQRRQASCRTHARAHARAAAAGGGAPARKAAAHPHDSEHARTRVSPSVAAYGGSASDALTAPDGLASSPETCLSRAAMACCSAASAIASPPLTVTAAGTPAGHAREGNQEGPRRTRPAAGCAGTETLFVDRFVGRLGVSIGGCNNTVPGGRHQMERQRRTSTRAGHAAGGR